MEEQKNGTFRKFVEKNSVMICGACLMTTGYLIGVLVGSKLEAYQINSGLCTMFAENPELKKIFMETQEKLLKKN